MATKTPLNVQSFPRPPLLERTPRHLQVKYNGQVMADTTEAYWVLETYHAPTYYLPRSSLSIPLTKTRKSTYCEWKGWATYYSLSIPQSSETIEDRIWSYDSPTKGYQAIKGYVSFYAGPWQCFVDGEEVQPQPGDFYGGWVTEELEGLIKGSKQTRHL
ncbi:hypothetical protein LOCC1_G007951 [Lachnellula occidentalis]|uniref:DUF427 domain-containing protein n=1 Tax=Lachnellula occidentalis TaxID=215460 RepID=A0A8H8RFT9_9HELO|nr:hypothetical protein LOCC1_G007951 [Lachnellula occidentalis]